MIVDSRGLVRQNADKKASGLDRAQRPSTTLGAYRLPQLPASHPFTRINFTYSDRRRLVGLRALLFPEV